MMWDMNNWRSFWAQKMKLDERLQVVSLVLLTRLAGGFLFETRLDTSKVLSDNMVSHSTRIAKWGTTLLDSNERFVLQPDGFTMQIYGSWRVWPFWKTRDFDGSVGEVEKDARSATYSFPWFGARIRQHVKIESDGQVTISMLTDWASGTAKLERITTAIA